jgi:hypothetical protein
MKVCQRFGGTLPVNAGLIAVSECVNRLVWCERMVNGIIPAVERTMMQDSIPQ